MALEETCLTFALYFRNGRYAKGRCTRRKGTKKARSIRSTVVIADSIIAVLSVWPKMTSAHRLPWLQSAVANSVSLSRMILKRVLAPQRHSCSADFSFRRYYKVCGASRILALAVPLGDLRIESISRTRIPLLLAETVLIALRPYGWTEQKLESSRQAECGAEPRGHLKGVKPS
jgi:hypothetical protein